MKLTFAVLSAVLLLFLCYEVYAEFPEIYPHDSLHTIRLKKALQSQKDLKKTIEKIKQSDIESAKLEQEYYHGLASNAASGFGNPFCDPGFTGSDCEYPICDQTNHHVHENMTATSVSIDFYYSQNATEYFFVYIDHTMHSQEFQLQVNEDAIPRMILVNSTGGIVAPEVTEIGPRKSIYTYYYTTPGVYKVQLVADNPQINVLVFFNAYTYLTTEIGGIEYDGLSSSAKRSDFPQDSFIFHTKTPTLFVATPVGLEFPGTLSTVSFFRDDGPAPHNVKLLLRYGCHYAYYTGEFACNDEGYYFARVRGYDFQGHTFVRSHAYSCEIFVPPPTTPGPGQSTPVAPTGDVSCFNGGAPIKEPNGTTYCLCPGLYTGPYCGSPLCMNGGEVRSSFCICPEGYSGSHCQNVNCVDDANSGFLIGNPMPVFIIRTRTTMKDVITQIKDALFNVLSDITYDPAYVSRFGLVTFNNNQSNFNAYYDVTSLINALNTASQTTDSSGNCSDVLYGPLLGAYGAFMITNKSPIYIITDGIPSDTHYVEEVNRLNSYIQSPINFIYIEPTQSSGCPLFDYNSPGFRPIIETSFRFSGIASFITQANQKQVGTLFQAHMAHTYHKSHLVFSDDQRDCTNLPSYIPVSIDANFHQLVFVVEGTNVTFQLNQPDGTVTSVQSVQVGAVSIFWLTGLQYGMWTATVVPGTSRTACSVRGYAVETPTPATIGQDYHMVFGVTHSLVNDAPERQPVVGIPHSIVAHIENYRVRDPSRVNAELIVYTDGTANTNSRQLVMASNGVWRSGCSYELYFPPFFCLRENINLYFTIFVKDFMGNQIQRAGVFYCAAIHPPPSPSPGTCANGGISINGTCLCQPGWQGDYCTQRVCYNGGTLDAAGYCRCPPGTGGESCEYLRCIDKNTRANFNNHGRHMMFILDITNNNAPVLTDLAKYIPEVIRDIGSTHRDWISRYFVVGVNSTGSYTLGSAFGGDAGGVQQLFNNAQQLSVNSQDSSKTIRLYSALTHHMYEFNENSYMNVFTYGSPNITDSLRGYDYVLQSKQLLNVFVSTDTSGNYNSGTDDDWVIFNELADLTTGQLFKITQGNMFNAMKLFPTWYSSSLVYYKNFNDCTNNASIFAPIDIYTQSIQIYVTGQKASNTGGQSTLIIQQANGSVVTPKNILTDGANNIGVFDVRRPCDDNWEEVGTSNPYCYLSVRELTTWNDAQQICAQQGGFLVDDFTSDRDQWLGDFTQNKPTWLSLNSQSGQWMWDRGNVQPPTPLNGTFHPWLNGDNSVDPTKPCVYRDNNGNWVKAACTDTKFYVCEKFGFNQDYQPSDINDDDLMPGRWQVTFSSPGKCSILVKVQSSIQVYTNFVTHVLSDFGTADGISDTTDNRAISHLVGVAAVNHIPYLTNALVIDGKNGTLYRAATYQYRLNCAYEYLSQNFTCPYGENHHNRFDIIHMGEDEIGLPFQRITSGICQSPRFMCRNGLYYNGQCICDEYYEGIYCEVPICVNGGLLNTADNTCQCPKGYTGRNCQYDLCYTNSNATFSIDNKVFIVVLELTTQNKDGITGFGQNLTNVFNSVLSSSSQSWFNQYILITFDANGFGSVFSATTPSEFSNTYNSATSNPSSNVACSYPIFKTITAVLQNNIPSQSVMYIITTGGSSDSESDAYNAFNAAGQTDVSIYYVLVPNDACPNEQNKIGSGYVSDIAVGTDGNAFIVDPYELGNFAAAHLPTIYNGTVLGTPTLQNNTHTCAELAYYFPIGIRATTIYIYVYSEYGLPSITDPNGNTITLQGSDTIYVDNLLSIYQYDSTGQGIYALSIADPFTCMVQVRIKGGAEIYPSYIPVPPENPDAIGAHIDGTTAVPQAGVNLLALHIANERVEPQFARLWPPHNSFGEIQYLQLYRREGCSYEWYSDAFNCDEDGYFITVFGIGMRAAPFARHFYTKCNGYNSNSTATPGTIPTGGPTTTTTTPVITTTSPGQTTTTTPTNQVTADIVFIFDVSADITTAMFNDTQNFVKSALQGFNVGYQKGVQVALISVTGDFDQFALTDAQFNGIADYQSLVNALTQARSDKDANSGIGNAALLQALNIITSPQFSSTGYRTSIPEHLIVYITTNSSPNPPAIQKAQDILNKKTYSFLAIAYQGNGGNIDALGQLTGKSSCVWTAANSNDYNGLATKLTTNINNAYQQGNSNFC